MSDRKAAKEGNYQVREAKKNQKAWEKAQDTLKELKKKFEK